MYPRILVPVDGSDASTCGLNEAIRIAKQQGSTLRLLHVVNAPVLDYGYDSTNCRTDIIESLCEAGKKILNSAEAAARHQGLAPECMMFECIGGPAADVILEQARQWAANLIVMGTHARHGLFRMGSDTAAVLGETPVPVLVVRGAPPSITGSEHRPVNYVPVA